MPFTIPNAANAEDVTQAQPDSVDFSILVAAFAGTGVVTGCAVTAQGAPNMTVAVASGTVAIAAAQIAVTGGNVTITAANATNPRFDLICVDNAGVKSAVAGTPNANPVFPAIPASSVVLAAVRVPAAVASINAAKITDKRVAAVLPAPTSFSAGMMMPYAGAAAPTGWQLCDGSAISRTTYATLFALIGTTFGAGDGSSTFNVPDLRGRSPVGYAASGGHTDVSTLGANDGVAVANRRPRHSHSLALTLPNHIHTHALTLPAHIHAHSFTLPNHGHADNITFGDNGHSHSVAHNAVQVGAPNAAGSGSIANIPVAGAPTYWPVDPASVGTNGAFASIIRTGGAVGNPNSNPAITGAVSNPTTSPVMDGTIGNPTSNPTIAGTVGVAGVTDSQGYQVVNFIIKL